MDNPEILISKKNMAEEEYYDVLIKKYIGSDINFPLCATITKMFIENPNYVLSLAKARSLNPDFITLSDAFKIRIMSVIVATYRFDMNENPNLIVDDTYLKRLLEEVYRGLLCADFYDMAGNSIFLSNPAISMTMHIFAILREKGMESITDPVKRDVYTREIDNLIDSMTTVFSLFDKKCFPQAMSVFRQALEIFITIRTLDMFPESLSSFVEHQRVTIEDALETMGKKGLDDYIKSHDLTYNNYKSYLNYGWLDSIPLFQEMKKDNPKIKYSIKTTAEISSSMEFYDAMNFASNYVHSNFVFVNINWDIVISEVLDGAYQIIDWLIEKSAITNQDILNINGIDYKKLYYKEKERILNVIKNDSYSFN